MTHILSLLAVLLLTQDDVGPRQMPTDIEPVEAPFPTATFQRPQFPDRCDTVTLSGRGLMTTRLQAAIDRSAAAGGGTVVVPAGDWHSGRLVLKSNVNLHLAEGCSLHFSGDIKDYQPAVFTRDEGIEVFSLGAFIYADGQDNIALTGRGRIVGPSTACEVFRRNATIGYNIEDDLAHLPLGERVFDGRHGGMVYLPKSFAPIRCTHVFVEGVTFDQGLFWNVVPQYCQHVVIRGVTVTSHGHGRTDGIDIDSCDDVLVEYCSLDCQDDCYTLKSGRGTDGIAVGRPTRNVVVRKSLALRGAGGLVCGTETAGGIRNVYATDCVFRGTDQAFRFKTRRPRGGLVENIYVERIRADVRKQALFIDMLGSARYVGSLASRYPAPEVNALTPKYRNLSIHDVEIVNCRDLIDVHGLPESLVENVFFGNATARCQTIGTVADARKFSVKDIVVETEGQNALFLDNCDLNAFYGFHNATRDTTVSIVKRGGECRHLLVQDYPHHPVTYDAIRPGEVWLDTEGKPIQAHGFQVTYMDGRYYWYGEDKTETLFGTNRIFCGVRCYSSTDFYNWHDEGRIIVPSSDPTSPLHHSQKLERPHILHCAKTGKYVCWMKFQHDAGHFVILEADRFMGPYHYVRSLKPQGYAVGDFDMYADAATGQAYVWFERPHWEYVCAELTDDYLGVTDRYSTHFSGVTPPLTREAAAHFMVGDKHYMFTSGTTGYTPNPSEVAEFDDCHGPYRVLGDPHIGDPYAHSFCSQITGVIKIPGRDLYVALADRWQPHTDRTEIPRETFAQFMQQFRDHKPYERDFAEPQVHDRYYTLVNPNQDVYKATYVFLPVVFRDGVPMIEWRDEWRVEEY